MTISILSSASYSDVYLGGIYMFDEPFYVRWLFNLVSVFLSSKIKSRLHIESKHYGILSAVVGNTSELPTCLGGRHDLDSDSPANEYMKSLFFPEGKPSKSDDNGIDLSQSTPSPDSSDA